MIVSAAARTARSCGGFKPATADAHVAASTPDAGRGACESSAARLARLGRRNADAAPANPPARHVASNASISRSGGVRDATRETVTAAPRLETARITPSRRSRSSGAFRGPPPFPVSHLVAAGRNSSTRHTRTRSLTCEVSADERPPTLAPDHDRDPARLCAPVSTPSTTPNAWYRSLVRRAGSVSRRSRWPPRFKSAAVEAADDFFSSKTKSFVWNDDAAPSRLRPSATRATWNAERSRVLAAIDSTTPGAGTPGATPPASSMLEPICARSSASNKGAKCSTYARPLGKVSGGEEILAPSSSAASLRSAARSACAADQRNATATRSSHSGTTQGGSGGASKRPPRKSAALASRSPGPSNRPRRPPKRLGGWNACVLKPRAFPPTPRDAAAAGSKWTTAAAVRDAGSPAPSSAMTCSRSQCFSARRFSRAALASARSRSRLPASSARSRIMPSFAAEASLTAETVAPSASELDHKSRRPANEPVPPTLRNPESVFFGLCVGPPARTSARMSASVRDGAPREDPPRRFTEDPASARARARLRSYGDCCARRRSSTAGPSPRLRATGAASPNRSRISNPSSSSSSSSSTTIASPTSGSSASAGYDAKPPRSAFHESSGSAAKPPPPRTRPSPSRSAAVGARALVARRSRSEGFFRRDSYSASARSASSVTKTGRAGFAAVREREGRPSRSPTPRFPGASLGKWRAKTSRTVAEAFSSLGSLDDARRRRVSRAANAPRAAALASAGKSATDSNAPVSTLAASVASRDSHQCLVTAGVRRAPQRRKHPGTHQSAVARSPARAARERASSASVESATGEISERPRRRDHVANAPGNARNVLIRSPCAHVSAANSAASPTVSATSSNVASAKATRSDTHVRDASASRRLAAAASVRASSASRRSAASAETSRGRAWCATCAAAARRSPGSADPAAARAASIAPSRAARRDSGNAHTRVHTSATFALVAEKGAVPLPGPSACATSSAFPAERSASRWPRNSATAARMASPGDAARARGYAFKVAKETSASPRSVAMRVARRDASPSPGTATSADSLAAGAAGGTPRRRASLFSSDGASASSAAAESAAETTTPSAVAAKEDASDVPLETKNGSVSGFARVAAAQRHAPPAVASARAANAAEEHSRRRASSDIDFSADASSSSSHAYVPSRDAASSCDELLSSEGGAAWIPWNENSSTSGKKNDATNSPAARARVCSSAASAAAETLAVARSSAESLCACVAGGGFPASPSVRSHASRVDGSQGGLPAWYPARTTSSAARRARQATRSSKRCGAPGTVAHRNSVARLDPSASARREASGRFSASFAADDAEKSAAATAATHASCAFRSGALRAADSSTAHAVVIGALRASAQYDPASAETSSAITRAASATTETGAVARSSPPSPESARAFVVDTLSSSSAASTSSGCRSRTRDRGAARDARSATANARHAMDFFVFAFRTSFVPELARGFKLRALCPASNAVQTVSAQPATTAATGALTARTGRRVRTTPTSFPRDVSAGVFFVARRKHASIVRRTSSLRGCAKNSNAPGASPRPNPRRTS